MTTPTPAMPSIAAGAASASPVPGRRDPEGRRRAIIASAAELIMEGGLSALTHRAVAARAGVSLGSTTQYFASIDELREAAYQLLADEIDEELRTVARHLRGLHNHPEDAAAVIHKFLVDERQVRAEIALIHAGTTDPTRRSLALRWFDQLVDLIAEHLDRDTALAIAVYLDGTTVHAGLHDTPLDLAHLTRVLRALVSMSSDRTEAERA